MRLNNWIILLLGVAVMALMWPGPALADSAEEWALPYMREIERLGFLPAERAIQSASEISRPDFFGMLNSYLEEFRGEEAKNLGEQRTRSHTEDWIIEQSGYEWPVSRIEGLRALARVEKLVLPDELENDAVYLDCRHLSEEDRRLLGYYQNTQRIHGYPDGTFRPEEPLKYGEAGCLFFQSLYADENERPAHLLEAVELTSLVNPAAFDRRSQWAWSAYPSPQGGLVYLNDGTYPMDFGRLRILCPPTLHTGDSGRHWIHLDMDYARNCPKGYDVYLICDSGKSFRRRSNFEEFFQIQEGRAKLYYPLVSKYDSFTTNEEGGLDYHFEDCSWAAYDGTDIDYLLLHEPLFSIWLAVPWPTDETS